MSWARHISSCWPGSGSVWGRAGPAIRDEPLAEFVGTGLQRGEQVVLMADGGDRTWHAALAADQRFSSLRKAAVTEAAEAAEAVRDGFEWRATLRPAGLPAGLDFKIRLHDKSASYTPLDRNNQAAFGRDPTNGDTYVLRQWYDSKRIGSRALNAEILASYDAPPTAEGVASATTRTVVASALAVLALDFVLTVFMFRGTGL